jgi:hypothetical protein
MNYKCSKNVPQFAENKGPSAALKAYQNAFTSTVLSSDVPCGVILHEKIVSASYSSKPASLNQTMT